jgi:hypothetical protein
LAAIAEPLAHPYDAELNLDFVTGIASADDDLFKSVLELARADLSRVRVWSGSLLILALTLASKREIIEAPATRQTGLQVLGY